MKVKGGGRRKSAVEEEENCGGDSNTNTTNPPPQNAPPLLAFEDAQPVNDGDVGVAQPEPEPEDEDDDADVEVDDEADAEADEDADDNAERPKLDEGFYEIEAIRRKRVRKGQLQYLIKWRGWPETANTWEPLENLQACSDFIEAFEESLRSGKQRKRKRKSGAPHTQVKRRQPRSTGPSSNSAGLETNNVNKPLFAAIGNLSLANHYVIPQPMCFSGQVECSGVVNNNETSKKVNGENGLLNVLPKCSGRKKANEYDPKLSELKTTTSASNADRLAIHVQEGKASEGNGTINGITGVNCTEPGLSTRSTGAKRRKSGSVKRIKQELQLCETPVTQNLTIGTNIVSGGRVEIPESGNFNVVGEYSRECSSQKNRTTESDNASRITKILKPIGYSATVINNVQDVSVTFMAMRADGREVMVDNKFLKANNPLLLISYYEQHLRYSPTS